jgi:hypothetical protein
MSESFRHFSDHRYDTLLLTGLLLFASNLRHWCCITFINDISSVLIPRNDIQAHMSVCSSVKWGLRFRNKTIRPLLFRSFTFPLRGFNGQRYKRSKSMECFNNAFQFLKASEFLRSQRIYICWSCEMSPRHRLRCQSRGNVLSFKRFTTLSYCPLLWVFQVDPNITPVRSYLGLDVIVQERTRTIEFMSSIGGRRPRIFSVRSSP